MLNENDMNIVREIDARITSNPNYWSFQDIKKKTGIHSITRYPATMVPQMLEELISIIVQNSDTKNLLDPFMGSGTVLVEGIKNNLNVYGTDINPLSFLMCKVKLQYTGLKALRDELNSIKKDVENGLPYDETFHFSNIDKWFRDDIKRDLSRLRFRVFSIQNKRVRDFFLVNLAEVITDVKNSQSSTFKLHAKKPAKTESFEYSVFVEFFEKINKSIMLLDEYYSILKLKERGLKNTFGVKSSIACVDNLNLKRALKLNNNQIDLIITSPPYGDNSTTVTYGQFSILPLFWIMNDRLAREFDNKLLRSFSAIDKDSLGGTNYTIDEIFSSEIFVKSKTLYEFYKLLYSHINIQNANSDNLKVLDKIRKSCSFVIDYMNSLEHQIDVLKQNGYMVLIVGNRRIHNYVFPFDQIILELLIDKFVLVKEFSRSIHNKRMANKISNARHVAVQSMTEETILVLRKI